MGELKTEPRSQVGAATKPDGPAAPGGGISSRAIGLDGWKTRMAHDEARFAKRSEGNATESGPVGFMDQRKELIVALRDVGGLRWGATDFGDKQSGDIMHFDGHHIALAGSIRRAKEAVVAAKAAAKKDNPGG